jgi:hypothetical protein
VRLKLEMERDIDLRVVNRTADLRQQIAEANDEARAQKHRADINDRALEQAQSAFEFRERNYCYTIRELKELVESNLKPSFLSRLTWKTRARRALAEAAGLLPSQKE